MNLSNYCAGNTIIALDLPQSRHLVPIIFSIMVAPTVIDVIHYH